MGKQIGLLIDLDGTVYRGTDRIDDANQFIQFVKHLHIPYLFVTNNSTRTPEAVAHQLNEMGIEAVPDDVYTTSMAAVRYMLERNRGKNVYFIGEAGLEKALNEGQFTITDDHPDYVVQGNDRQFTYEKLGTALQCIRDGAEYILTNPDLLLPLERGFAPGAGSISAAIQAGSQVNPVIIGKPSATIMQYALERMNLSAKDVWVIGDNLFTDIAAGRRIGCQTALVLTGMTNEQNLEELVKQSGVEADRVFQHLMDFAKYIGSD